MNDGKNWKQFIRDRAERLFIVVVFLPLFFIDVRIVIAITMIMGLFFLNINSAIRGAFLGIAFGVLITLIISVVAQDRLWIIAVIPYSILSGAVVGFYTGGLIGASFRGPSNNFGANVFVKWRQK